MATVSPLPRTNIITLASPSAGPWLVGFRLFEATALRVYVNGALSTDFTVSANFVNGYDDNATITAGSTLATSTEIQIDGFMTPQRQDDYRNGPGLIDDLNIELGRVWATLSENRMLLKRAILGLKENGAGDVADAGGRRIKNIGAPTESNDALRAVDVQAIAAGGGNVPSPLGGQVGHLLQATGIGTFGWISRAVALGAALEAVRGLTPAADRMPYFTGANTAALATITSLARQLLDDSDQATMRGTLGLSALASLAPGLEGQAIRVTGGAPVFGSVENPQTIQPATGTSEDFVGIPAWVNEITITASQVSMSGADNIDIRLGNSGGYVATGYVGAYGSQIAGAVASSVAGTTGIPIIVGNNFRGFSGIITIRRHGPTSSLWQITYEGTIMTISTGVAVASVYGGGELTIADLTQVRFRPFGTDTFDNGSFGCSWK